MFESKSIIRCATLRDMQGSQFKKNFAELEDFQSKFFFVQNKVKVAEPYIWPLRPLYEWSRRVEYPFVVSMIPKKSGIRMLDAGSGVTFFPLYLTKVFGISIECLDKEQSYKERMIKLSDLLCISPPIPFHIADLTQPLPFPDNIFDVVSLISVLEHLPIESRIKTVYELWRILVPGGRLIMTFDASLTGEAEGLPLSEVEEFKSKLEEVIGPLPPLPSLPPDLLTPQHPGYGLAPVQVGVDGPLIRFGLRSWLFRLLDHPLPIFKPLACLLCSILKPRGGDL